MIYLEKFAGYVKALNLLLSLPYNVSPVFPLKPLSTQHLANFCGSFIRKHFGIKIGEYNLGRVNPQDMGK